ncbi:MAG: glycerate kinase [Eubacteriales bacterium]|nr:glycerate kinase [Eubacteriales bacterium]
MKFLFASDSFKGSLSSVKCAELLEQVMKEIFPNATSDSIEIADGGEGTCEAVLNSVGGESIELEVLDPLLRPIKAHYARLKDGRTLMEMASASGLTLLEPGERNPLETSSYGTGQMIKHALDMGSRDISIAIGGSATNDGGTGAIRALGARFLDSLGNELQGCGKDLEKIAEIDLSGLDKRIAECKFTVMCDVTNVLCGEHGATYTFGMQKGADDEKLAQLEKGMKNYRDHLKKLFNVDCDSIQGAGAAGGLGAALMLFLKAQPRRGIESVLELVRFDERIADVDYVITGEGATDWQSCYGKVLHGIGTHCKAKGIPAFAIVGSMGKGAEDIFEHGIESIVTTVNAPMSLDCAMQNAEALYKSAANRLFRIIKFACK